jgi:hypothetical protein
MFALALAAALLATSSAATTFGTPHRRAGAARRLVAEGEPHP